jgi:hypothetical protein
LLGLYGKYFYIVEGNGAVVVMSFVPRMKSFG